MGFMINQASSITSKKHEQKFEPKRRLLLMLEV